MHKRVAGRVKIADYMMMMMMMIKNKLGTLIISASAVTAHTLINTDKGIGNHLLELIHSRRKGGKVRIRVVLPGVVVQAVQERVHLVTAAR